MTRPSTLVAGVCAGLLVLTACGGGADPLAESGAEPAPDEVVRIGSADFPENQILGEIYAQALEAQGVEVERSFNIGSREIYFPGLTDGSIDLIPDYTGVLLQFVDAEAEENEPDEVYAALQERLPEPLTVLARSEAENKDAVVVTAETAERLGATSIGDLAPSCGELTFGGPSEFQSRPDGIPGIEANYGCTFGGYQALDTGGPVTVGALADGTIDAANLFTTDPTIADQGFVVLEDPENNFAAQNVVPLINSEKATPEVTEALDAVSAALTTQALVELNREFAADDRPNVETVAQEWLEANGLV